MKAPPSGGVFLDRPFIAFTQSMVHLTISAFNLGGTTANGTLVWRFPISQLGTTIRSRSAVFGGNFVRPAQAALPGPGSTQYFGQRADDQPPEPLRLAGLLHQRDPLRGRRPEHGQLGHRRGPAEQRLVHARIGDQVSQVRRR